MFVKMFMFLDYVSMIDVMCGFGGLDMLGGIMFCFFDFILGYRLEFYN